MKKKVGRVLIALLLLTVSGCGGAQGGPEPDQTEFYVNLTELYTDLEAACGWGEDYMDSVDGELLESYYPGLSNLEAPQLIVKVPAMSSDVNEIVLLQCGTEEDADAAAEILQTRIDSQVEGGAWYAETQASWEKAAVLRQGTYAALIASGEYQTELEEQFNQQFS